MDPGLDDKTIRDPDQRLWPDLPDITEDVLHEGHREHGVLCVNLRVRVDREVQVRQQVSAQCPDQVLFTMWPLK